MKFQIGDRVRVKSLDEIAKMSDKDEEGDFCTEYEHYDTDTCRNISDGCFFIKDMFKFCDGVFTISGYEEDLDIYYLEGDDNYFSFIDKWLDLEKPKESGYVADFSGNPDTVGEIFNELLPRLEEMFREVYNKGYEDGKNEHL